MNPQPGHLPGARAALAAALLAVDPGLGGAALRSPPGAWRDQWLARLRHLLPEHTPWLRVPTGVSDSALLGGLDLSATLQAGRPVLQRGLLARADGGFLLLVMAERVAAGTAAHLASALDTRQLVLQRDGLSERCPARLAVLALDEGANDDERLPAALLDRLAFHLLPDAPGEATSGLGEPARGAGERGATAETAWGRPASAAAPADTDDTDYNINDYNKNYDNNNADPLSLASAEAVAAARERLPRVRVPDSVLQALCGAALAWGIDSLRAPLLAVRAARAAAALAGLDAVDDTQAALAASLVLAPRATRLPAPVGDEHAAADAAQDETAPEPPQPPEQASDPAPDATPPDTPPDAALDPTPTGPGAPDAETAPSPPEQVQALEQKLVEAVHANIPPGLLAALQLGQAREQRAAAGGRAGAAMAHKHRGRPIGSRRGEPRSGARLHLLETLRAAAPWQRLRQREAPSAARIQVRREDFHVVRYRQHRPSTTVFVVDASGSAALHRLAEAKGAVELLLADCYVRRDRVAVLAFRGPGSELLLPPTRSLARAKRSLSGLPGGGGTPLAAGIEAAAALGAQLVRQGDSTLVVLLTDGRANLSRDGSAGRAAAALDALNAAQAFRQVGLSALLIDTSPQPSEAAEALAGAMQAAYLPLPHAGARHLSQAVQLAAHAGARPAARSR